MAEQHAVMRDTVNHKDNEDQTSAASPSQSIKNSLCFILDNEVSTSKRTMTSDQLNELDEPTAAKRKRPLVFANTISSLLAPVASIVDEKEAQNTNVTSPPSKRKASIYCIVEGCISRAKHARRCWKHGGSVKCRVVECQNRAKSKGVCWSHGGGTICSSDRCMTIAVSNGVCWAHGGGKRCMTLGCYRPAFERTGNLCPMHYNAGSST
ncbi:unnamed protein product [Peronospora destructor]|uniref:WRKY19-like zinc finger domain-containing protein n=1 Tax=Peronospora destructor TaxID=86335 RepID=A0AAV0UJ36_9STRA|nr:unnamed protein product [Peronospora destructor]